MLRDESKMDETTENIRRLLPSLKVLNSVVLPKKISFEDDDDAEKELPKSIKKLSTNDLSVNELVLHFLREYFSIYDSDNRWGSPNIIRSCVLTKCKKIGLPRLD